MDEDQILQSIIADPKLTDSSIDVGQLRQTTDTRQELLGNITDFQGLKYDPTVRSYVQDLYRVYGGGAPMLPETVVNTPVVDTTPIVDTSAMDEPAGDSMLDTTPTTTTTTSPFVETSPNILSATDPNTGQPTSGNIVDPKTGDVFAPGDYSDVAGTLADPREKIDFTPEQQGTIQNILGQAGQTVEGALTELGKIPGAIVDKINQTVNVFGKKIDVGKTLGFAAINEAVGGPVSLTFGLLPERDPRQSALEEFYDVKDGTIQSGLMKGYNPVSGNPLDPTFGLQKAYDKRIDTIENTLKDKYNLSAKDIAGIKAGTFNTEKLDVQTDLVQRLVDLEDAKAREKDVLDASETGAPQENIGATDTIASLQDKERLDQQRLASLTGDVDFDIAPTITTKPVTGVTRPGTVLGKPGIERFDDAETDINVFDTTPIKTTAPMTLADDRINRMTDDVDLDVFDTTPQDTITPIAADRIGTFDADTFDEDVGFVGPQLTTTETYTKEEAFDIAKDLYDQGKLKTIDQLATMQDELAAGQTTTYEILTNLDPIEQTTDKIDKKTTAPISITPLEDDFDFDIDDFEVSGDVANVGTTMDLIGPEPTSQDIDVADGGAEDPARDNVSAPSGDVYSGAAYGYDEAAEKSDNGGNGGGSPKIVCTMMNESYGFGSFRNKIWLRHSKGLAPEYQKGYHKIFLPLVKLSKKNIVLKKILEHIAVHRTIDIRQESRGKVHLLGRIYRKILEPICYFVGKHG